MTRTVLVTGATGFLGREVVRAFQRAGWEVVGTGFTRARPPSTLKVDLGSEEEIVAALDKIKPQVVVHCAANRFPDKCDADPSAARAINTTASSLLARATTARSILLIYISTDYVFSGAPGDAPYENDAPTDPPNLYGQTKLDGETSVLEETADTGLGLVLRVPVLYGHAENNQESAVNVLLDAVWKAQEKGARISMDDWALRYPTNTEDVGRVCQDVAVKYLEAGSERPSLPSILQFSSEDRYTKFEICELLAEIMGLPLDGMVRNQQGNIPSAVVQRPYDAHLSTNALKDLGIDVQTQNFRDWWRREVRAVRR